MSPAGRTSDDAVIAAAKTGDPAAWRELYRRVGGRLYGWLGAQAMLDPAIDADDVANETWLTAARRIHEFAGDIDGFAGWLFVIARNLTTNVNRRSLRRGTTPIDTDPRQLVGESLDTDEGAIVDAADWARRLMSHLSGREYEVVALVDIACLDIATAAQVLGMSRTAVRVAHHRAMRRLRTVLDVGDDQAVWGAPTRSPRPH